MVDRQFVSAAFVSGIHRLGGPEEVCDFFLRFVMVFSQIAHSLEIWIIHLNAPSSLLTFCKHYTK